MSLSPTAARLIPGSPTGSASTALAVFFVLTFLALLVVVALLPAWASPPRRSSRAGRWSPRSSSSASPKAAAATATGVPGWCGGGSAGSGGWWRSAPRWRCWPLAVGRERRDLGRARARPHRAALVEHRAVRRAAASSTRSTGRSARSPAGAATRCPSCRSGGRRSSPGLVLAPIVALWHLPLVTTGQLAPVGLPDHVRHHPGLRRGCSTAPAAACCSPSSSTSRRAPFSYGVLGFTEPTPPGWTGSSACCGSPSPLAGDRLRPGGVAGGPALGSRRHGTGPPDRGWSSAGSARSAVPARLRARLSSPAARDHRRRR